MSDAIRILLVGESWVSTSTHIKGWDFFSSSVYEEGHEYLLKALPQPEFELVHMPGHKAPSEFPTTVDGFNEYDVVILSDIGANTLLLHPDVWVHGKTVPNRLQVLAQWVRNGGALIMCGGYLSFSGIYGSAKFYNTPVEEILPVTLYERDDRVEAPQGARVNVTMPDHPVVKGIHGEWPVLLGYNEVKAKPEADLIAEIDGRPFIASIDAGKGKSLVWTSDIGPHWCPVPFLEWNGYNQFWQQSMRWLGQKK